MQIEDVIERYFSAMRARDVDAAKSLYADDAVFCLPDGREFAGAEAIGAMHAHVFAAGAPVPTPGVRIVTERAAAVEIEARLPDGSARHTTNHFTLDAAGRIVRLNVYVKAEMK
jgi:uncharacterized protein (TIGR02246 family)